MFDSRLGHTPFSFFLHLWKNYLSVLYHTLSRTTKYIPKRKLALLPNLLHHSTFRRLTKQC